MDIYQSNIDAFSIYQIATEVERHDFCVAHMSSLVPSAKNKREALKIIEYQARMANLKVSLNHELGLCFFERLD